MRKQGVFFKILWWEIGIAIAIAMKSPEVLDGYFGGSGSDQRKLFNDVQNTNQKWGLAMESAAIRHKKTNQLRLVFVIYIWNLFQFFLYFDFLERFDNVVLLNVVVIFNLHTTIVSFGYFFDIVFETF